MAHPFFDSISYPWARDDAQELHWALAQAISGETPIRQLLQQVIGDATALENGSPADMWTQSLDLMARAGALGRLCGLLQDDPRVRGNAVFQQKIVAVLEARPATAIEELNPRVLLLDRTNLREQLDELALQDSPLRVLLVRGGTKSGKSHGRYLFAAAAAEHGARPVYLFNPIVSTVPQVIDQLFAAFNARDRIPSNFTTDAAYYQTVCVELQQVALERRQRLWIAVDDLGVDAQNAPLLDPEIRVFCESLALNMLNPLFGDWFRLMLIHYPEQHEVPTQWGEDVWAEDRTSESDVQQEHIGAFLASWSARNGPRLSEFEVESLAQEVIARADAPRLDGVARPRLKRLHTELLTTLKSLRARSR